MRYTQIDHDRATALLFDCIRGAPALAPSERRVLQQLRTAYLMHADVPLSEVKLARAIIGAADAVIAHKLMS